MVKYRLPEDRVLEDMANVQIDNEYFESPLALTKVNKKNRKNYEIVFTGSYREADAYLTGLFNSDFTYEEHGWSMSQPTFVQVDGFKPVKKVDKEIALAYIMDRVLEDKDYGIEDIRVIYEDVEINLIAEENKSKCGFTVIFVHDNEKYDAKGVVEYALDEANYLWAPVPETFRIGVAELGPSLKPEGFEIARLLSSNGIEIPNWGNVYFDTAYLYVQVKDFTKQGDYWIASCAVEAKSFYISGTFTVDIPFMIYDDELVTQFEQTLKAENVQLELSEEGKKLLVTPAIQDEWVNEQGINLTQDSTFHYYSFNDKTQIAVGERVKTDIRDVHNVIISYPVTITGERQKITLIVDVPIKVVLGEVLVQLQSKTYSNIEIDVYPVTEGMIKKDLNHKYLQMESSEGVVMRDTQEGLKAFEVINKQIKDNEEIYRVAAKFAINENGVNKEYVGQYEITYSKNEYENYAMNIQFIQ